MLGVKRAVPAAVLGVLLGAVALQGPALGATLPAAGEAPAWIAKAQKLGPAASDQKVTISAFLGLRDIAALKALVAAQTTPGNAQYGRYLTPADFRKRFAPDAARVRLVQQTLAKLGFAIEHVPLSGFYVEVSGTVGQVRTAFHVSQNLYRFRGRVLRANAESPTLPATLAGVVQYVGGLSDQLKAPTHVVEGVRPVATDNRTPAAVASSAPLGTIGPAPWLLLARPYCSTWWGDHSATVTPTPAPYDSTLPWANCGYTPQQMAAAYGVTNKILKRSNGAGVRIAITDAYASPTILKDANQYFKNHNVLKLDATNFSQIVPLGINKVSPSEPCGPQGWFEEESLDVEAAHSMAPGAQLIYVGSRDCGVSLDNALYDTIDNHLADIITNSWGYRGENGVSGAEIATSNAMFLQAAAEGISVLFSSGDDGSNQWISGLNEEGDWPSTSPYVTAVGGTTLGLLDSTGNKVEYGWGNYNGYLNGSDLGNATAVNGVLSSGWQYNGGAGGGPSLSQLQPDWQIGIVRAGLSTRTYDWVGNPLPFASPHRVTPDISLDADPQSGFLMGEAFTVVAPGGDPGCVLRTGSTTIEYCEFVIGGTSLASPLLAGVLALVNQHRASLTLPPVGFVNPRLYALKPDVPGSRAAITDVVAPASFIADLRPYPPGTPPVRVRTINSSPTKNGVGDVSQATAPGYDNITGLGTPWVPALIQALSKD